MGSSTAFAAGILSGLLPPPKLTVSQWADRHRRLSSKSSAEPGAYRTDRTPYLREIMDQLGPQSDAEMVIVMKGAQVGATEAGNNWVGYAIHHNPGPFLMVLPTVETAKRSSKLRIAPMIHETPELAERVIESKSRDSGNTILQKEFPGGTLVIAGANSAVGLRSIPVRFLMLDEVDGYPADVDGEGDPVELAKKRTATFGSKRKVYADSTPTDAATSRISRLFEDTDQRFYHVPCPFCEELQVIAWKAIEWPQGEPRKAAMRCQHCRELIPESKKPWMLAEENGACWIATSEGDGGRTVGYHLSALYSPLGWYSWGEAAEAFLKAKREGADKLREWTNLVLGETWQDEAAHVDSEDLLERCEAYEAPCPTGVLVLTAGVDVQADRLELTVVGWGLNEESWAIDHRVFYGDPGHRAVWQQLDAALAGTYEHQDGRDLRIASTCVDSGYATTQVYEFCLPRQARRIFAIKGMAGESRALVTAPARRKAKRGSRTPPVFTVGTHEAKRILYARLALTESGPGYCHHPIAERFGAEYFAQLTGEKLVKRYSRGVAKYEWVQHHPRVEALDCRVYAHAALVLLNPTWSALKDAADLAVAKDEPPPEPEDELRKISRARKRKRRRQGHGPY